MNQSVPPGNARLQPGRTEDIESANQEIGDPRWHSRGYMPHFESADAIQHVTYHLADSLPKAVVEQLDQALQQLPLAQQDVERRKRVNAWLDAGHGSCVLREPVIAAMVQNTFLHFDAQRYRLLAWVVMPNHVHVLFQPLPGWTMAKIVASWKSFTGRRISEWLKTNPGTARLPPGLSDVPTLEPEEPGVYRLPPGLSDVPTLEHGEPGVYGLPPGLSDVPTLERGEPGVYRIWHREYWDRFMRNEAHFTQAVAYIHQNPVKAGLVVNAADWQWSSAFPGDTRFQPGNPSTGEES